MTEVVDAPTIDTSDLDQYIGVPLTETWMVEPIAANDIKRFVQAMRYPNPLYYDPEYIAQSRFGELVAPQSFTIVTNANQGFRPAVQGTIPNSHQLFGGDEWWFYGPRIRPGDTMRVIQMMQGYRVVNTGFAGPTVIEKGDNHYTNQRGEPVALQRASSIRYIAAAAREQASLLGQDEEEFSDEEMTKFVAERKAYVDSLRSLGHDRRSWNSVNEGDELQTKVIGPHSHISFATEYRAGVAPLWNGIITRELIGTNDLGLTPEMTAYTENADWDPEFGDGAYYGAARGHLFNKWARWIGMPRSYGYGASMGAWVIDFLAAWGGEWGFVSHCNTQYRGPSLVGDVTYLRGTVASKSESVEPGQGTVTIDYVMSSHRDELLARGQGEVLLPLD